MLLSRKWKMHAMCKSSVTDCVSSCSWNLIVCVIVWSLFFQVSVIKSRIWKITSKLADRSQLIVTLKCNSEKYLKYKVFLKLDIPINILIFQFALILLFFLTIHQIVFVFPHNLCVCVCEALRSPLHCGLTWLWEIRNSHLVTPN